MNSESPHGRGAPVGRRVFLGFSPAEAHCFYRARAVVHGPPERTFTILTDVANSTSWVPDCEEVSTDTFTQTFDVRWAGHRFEVFVGEHVPPSRLGWLGIGAGVQPYQTWLLTEVEGGTDVVIENAVRGGLPSRSTLCPARGPTA
ncbi:SRPBCC family protein [Actinacidiphila oryziradicis]|uniref:SRPBCC family protein n=1 Tax=Actinacidiphila oryziradicis TaxID=2571141 RepID=UPI001B80BB4B|nr:SRPBCC family protein [Actinacidiphila oryziradicis]